MPENKTIKLFIIAGEASGDVHGAHIVNELRKSRNVEIYGTGGPLLKALGQIQYATVEDMAVIGFVEVFGKIRFLLKLAKKIEQELHKVKPDLILMVDYPGYNLRLSKKLHKYGIPIVQFSAPQFWIWHYSRVKTLKAYYQKVLCILPFEENILKKEGVNAVYIGHPVVEGIKFKYDGKDEFIEANSLDKSKQIVGLIPGSRHKEIKLLMPVIIEAAKRCEGVSFVLAKAQSVPEEMLKAYIPEGLDIKIVDGQTHDVMKYSDILWICSGTATLEAGIIGTPMIILYRSNIVNVILIKLMTSLRMIGLPNIICGRYVVPEVIGKDCTPEKLLSTHKEIISDPSKWRAELKPLAEIFVGRTPVKTAAEEIIKSIENEQSIQQTD